MRYPAGRKRAFRRGMTLVEMMVGIFVLGLTTVVATALFPASTVLREKSGDYSRASALVSRKLEQIRELEAEQWTRAGFQTAGIIDSTQASSTVFTFTTVDTLSTEWTGATGTLTLSGTADLMRADVTLTWSGFKSQQYQVTGSTFVASKETWLETP